MLKKFFIQFAACIAIVLVLGVLLSNMIELSHHVEYWIMLLIPTFAVPILTTVTFFKEPIEL
ncbi:hypothetical protein [Acinetobacter stercoris]|uniref:Uncharacterized protein n=1 Tax=Acinetobacter stercoris TaxID=2126983 RepID=A0A2U3N4S3_9GAMM|nr:MULTISPECIES: hypothetical protein [Acinetobacter]SPL72549.1 hypothetical protein KPC_3727 [Acinetobacter stercoris]